MTSNPVCTIRLTGPFRVTLASGEDVTPNSRLRCALLAVLAASPGRSVARARLQALFWSNSPADLSSGSLRSALFQLRRDLAFLGRDAIVAAAGNVSLAGGAWAVEDDPAQGPFLDGFDLNAKGAEGFEDWLRDRRGAAEPGAALVGAPPLVVDGPRTGAASLGLLAVEGLCGEPETEAAAEAAMDALVRALSQFARLKIFDLRGRVLEAGELDLSRDGGASVLLRPVVSLRGGRASLRVNLIAPRSGRILTALAPISLGPDVERVEIEMAHAAEGVLSALAEAAPDLAPAELMPWTVLSSLFAEGSRAVLSTEAEIDRLRATHALPVLECLKIFLQIFKENEGVSARPAHSELDLEYALEAVPVTDPLRPLCESLIGYAFHMLCANNEASAFLLETARRRAPNLALNLDHLAVLRLSEGRTALAAQVHEDCMRAGALSSWRYSYDITGAMVAMAAGDFHGALRRANRALMQSPRFIGALRYTMIGFAMNGSAENAALMKARIERLRPGYDMEGWLTAFIERSDPVFGTNVALTLERHGLL